MERRIKRFAAQNESVRSARAFVREVLSAFGTDAGGAILLTSELVSNAVEYASSEIDVVVCVDGETVRVEVHDGFTMTEAFRVVTAEGITRCRPRMQRTRRSLTEWRLVPVQSLYLGATKSSGG